MKTNRILVRTLSFALFAAIGLSTLCAEPAKKLALVGGMLLDGYDVPPLHHAAVLIEGNRIVRFRSGDPA